MHSLFDILVPLTKTSGESASVHSPPLDQEVKYTYIIGGYILHRSVYRSRYEYVYRWRRSR